MIRKIAGLSWIAFALILLAGPASAGIAILSEEDAAQSAQGTIMGFVSGPEKTGLTGASIVFRNSSTGKAYRVISGDRGVYRAAGLLPGTYEVAVELLGFMPKSLAAVPLAGGETRALNIDLQVATIRESVTVIGKLPKASLEAPDTRKSSARDVGEALAAVTGIAKVRKGGIANDVVLRGFASRDLNVLIDGERLYGACPNEMDPPSFHADFGEVDRIEVGKGPFDIKNQGSLGGVINIITKRPQDGFHPALGFSAGSTAYLNPTATFSYGSDAISALVGYSYRNADPYFDGSGKRFTQAANYRPDQIDSDSFKVGTGWGNFAVRPRSNHLLQLSYTHQAADHVLYPYLMMDAVYDNSDRLKLGYQVSFGSGGLKLLQFQGYYTDVRHWMTDELRTSSVSFPRIYSMGTRASTRTFGGKVEAAFDNLLVGTEAFRRGWNAATEMAGSRYTPQASIPDVTIDSLGFYADYSHPLMNGLSFDAAARVDTTRSEADPAKVNTNLYFAYHSTRRTSVTDTYPSATVRLSFQMTQALEIVGSFGSTVRVPDGRERFFALKRMGSDWVGNPDLKPSRNNGADVTATFRSAGLLLESSVYVYSVRDFITVQDQVKVNPAPGVMNAMARSYQNVNARMGGIEGNIVYSISSRFVLAGGLSYVRGTQDPVPAKGILSRNLSEIPPLSSRAALRYDDGLFSGEVEGIFAADQSRVNADLREASTPGYNLANLKFGVNFKRFSVRAGIDNIFNKDYVEFLSYQRDPFRNGVRVPEPGRTYYLNLAYRY
jgi:iron complex outermembrane receptor protein